VTTRSAVPATLHAWQGPIKRVACRARSAAEGCEQRNASDGLVVGPGSDWPVSGALNRAGSANGRPPGFGPGYLGSSPSPAVLSILVGPARVGQSKGGQACAQASSPCVLSPSPRALLAGQVHQER
jgi:hypothetical protein